MSTLGQPFHGVLEYKWTDNQPESLKVFPDNVNNLRTTCTNAMIPLQGKCGTNEKKFESATTSDKVRLTRWLVCKYLSQSTYASTSDGGIKTPLPPQMPWGGYNGFLVFAISNLLQVDIYYFSTRMQPCWITPREPLAPNLSHPCIAALHHVDSYAGTSQWFNICVDESKTDVPQQSQTISSVSKSYPTPPAISRSDTGATKQGK
ncbi:hypothetical protein K492DRAFT_189374 [Lichtheimia hyalospora FSU 10163]|nr:hypothetical protein K492DRAFT_189374 [Lichtheimia hyalospora FSU 10163]